MKKREQLINSELDSQIRSLSAQGYNGAEIAKELGMYSSTCYKIIAGKISLVEQSSLNDDAVEIVSMEDEHSGDLLKPVPMNSAKTLPAVEESKHPQTAIPEEAPKTPAQSNSHSEESLQNEHKVQKQLLNTVQLSFNDIRISYSTDLSIEHSVAELKKNMQR
ncbi:hypothetical protein SAMN02910357_02637 [Succinivibrio dextrinosolvens]|uniref:hypothetical protein n=1 Tax=Succinivibrio dextrinosolvens TaxID=83771 RepID=UPI0008E58F86|nr:hypothetical protein [Succinivibrio dextrinosolvens]SFS93257.1 hypothetical protein SAMN02910357_02637 [Succinivibrio dextrinosolvens]